MIFSPSVEQWRPQILRFVPNPAGGVDYWLAWMARESGGNLCSYTSLRESGLFQLMPPDNTNQGGTTEAALRPACSGQTVTRPFSDAEIAEQMVSFSRYLAYITNAARAKLSQAGVQWSESEPSFWSFVKLQHAYPAPTLGWLVASIAQLGRPPADWKEFRSTISGYASVLDNAEAVGFYGSGGWEIPLALGLVGVAALVYYWSRKRR